MSLAARRAVIRWSWRMFRREWRQQLLVLSLLTLTVAGSIFGSVAARSLAPDQDRDFGTATHMLVLESEDSRELATTLGQLRARFGTIDVIGHRRMAVPGSVDTVEYRSQDPDGRYASSLLGVRSGRYPRGDEVAVTDGAAASLGVGVGDHVDLDGVDRSVVGIVENPSDIDDEFALVAPGALRADELAVLVRTTEDGLRRQLPAAVRMVDNRGDDERTVAAVGALGLAVVVSILVCLVAAAGFVVVAQRRLRQLGMLASIGATERHLRLVVLANGLVVGAVAALLGAALAGVAWLVAGPTLERAAGHRFDRSDVPWWIVASGMGLALLTATAAAWWPGRTVARVPVHVALSSRPPGPRPVHRSALAAAVLIALGFAGLALGLDPTKEEANVALVLPGIAALVVGILLISPVAVKTLGPIGRRLPVAARLALRDLARNQARSGVALAAITLSLGLAVTTVIVAGAAEHSPNEGNLSDRQLLIRLGDREPVLPEVSPRDLDAKRAAVERFAATVGASTTALEVAITASEPERRDGVVYHPLVVLGRPAGDVTRDIGDLYVATPALAAPPRSRPRPGPRPHRRADPARGAAALRQHAATNQPATNRRGGRPSRLLLGSGVARHAGRPRAERVGRRAGRMARREPRAADRCADALRSEHGRRRGAHRRDP